MNSIATADTAGGAWSSTGWCASDMGVNWKGESPLGVNTAVGPFITKGTMAQALDRSNCGVARFRGKEGQLKPDEPMKPGLSLSDILH